MTALLNKTMLQLGGTKHAVYAPGNAGKSSGVMRPPTAPPAVAQRPPDMTPPEPGPPETDGKSSALKACLSLAACSNASRLATNMWHLSSKMLIKLLW